MSEASARRVGAGHLSALYVRAPDHTEWDRTSGATQLAACQALATELGYTIRDDAIFQDEDGGANASRPGLLSLLRLVNSGQVGAVVVYTLDRLAREGSALREALLKEFRRRDLPLYVARMPRGYRYGPMTGALQHDPAEVAAANQENWRPPEFIVLPRE